ncbi:NUDIX domain-containing protein [Lentzea sp. NPDC051213]|uniref:NUDIX domain-containing protein n=1 Tax=Lentzea sp. NPDC051213 TaxID=3364126 RepID=UPI0037937E86
MSKGNTSPLVAVYALIGKDVRLLLIEDRARNADVLPGGVVRAGEPIEHALRRSLHDQLGVTVAQADFCAVIEHGTADAAHDPESELAFVFDVTLSDVDQLQLVAADPRPFRWAGEHDLEPLRPEAIRDRLRAGKLLADAQWAWWPWKS